MDFAAREGLGDLLRRRRSLRGLTQQQLADLCGTSQKRISLIENGHVAPRLPMLRRLAAALDLSELDRSRMLQGGGSGQRSREALGRLAASVSALPCVVLDEEDRILAMNQGFETALRVLVGRSRVAGTRGEFTGQSLERLSLSPEGLLPALADPGQVARHYATRRERRSTGGPALQPANGFRDAGNGMDRWLAGMVGPHRESFLLDGERIDVEVSVMPLASPSDGGIRCEIYHAASVEADRLFERLGLLQASEATDLHR
jgi:transcriptional regulator with XRE-family HTH domain